MSIPDLNSEISTVDYGTDPPLLDGEFAGTLVRLEPRPTPFPEVCSCKQCVTTRQQSYSTNVLSGLIGDKVAPVLPVAEHLWQYRTDSRLERIAQTQVDRLISAIDDGVRRRLSGKGLADATVKKNLGKAMESTKVIQQRLDELQTAIEYTTKTISKAKDEMPREVREELVALERTIGPWQVVAETELDGSLGAAKGKYFLVRLPKRVVIEYGSNTLDLGYWKVGFALDRGTNARPQVVCLPEQPCIRSGCTHPHVRGIDPCLGEGDFAIRNALSEFDLVVFADLMAGVLGNYNDSSPFTRISSWNGLAPCSICGHPNGTKCSSCRTAYCSECKPLQKCHCHNNPTCPDCLLTCEGCGWRYCRQFSNPGIKANSCVSCGKTTCSKCRATCTCGTNKCKDCASRKLGCCYLCGAPICGDCGKETAYKCDCKDPKCTEKIQRLLCKICIPIAEAEMAKPIEAPIVDEFVGPSPPNPELFGADGAARRSE